MADVAQLVRAPGCGSGGRGFNSLHSPQIKNSLFIVRFFNLGVWIVLRRSLWCRRSLLSRIKSLATITGSDTTLAALTR